MYLFIDSSTKNFYIGLYDSNKWVYKHSIPTNNNLTDLAVEEIFNALKICNVNPTDLTKIYVVNGPGSFTGIRVSSVISKSLTLLNDKITMYTISSLRLASCKFDDCVSLIDARSSLYYCLRKVDGKIVEENTLVPNNTTFDTKNIIIDYLNVDIFSNVDYCIRNNLFNQTDPLNYESLYIKAAF
jgi:tRNA threonylcarbamoyladenosine biosynthesis protein TsaB